MNIDPLTATRFKIVIISLFFFHSLFCMGKKFVMRKVNKIYCLGFQ